MKTLLTILGIGFGDMIYYNLTGNSLLHNLVLYFATKVFTL